MSEEADVVDMDIIEKDLLNEIIPQNTIKQEKKISRNIFEFYYQNLFPYKYFFKWLSNEKTGNLSLKKDIFERREFTFTLEGDIYIRFLCFKNETELKSEILKAIPIKIDIGAIYNTLPKYHNSVMDSTSNGKSFTPVQKEMVFDIDMTDYDDVRSCCKDAKICDKCWCYMIIAYKILRSILEEDFGFKHNIWIFSGRRGIHCWVCDDRAKKLTNEGRSAVANYIKIKITNVKTGSLFVLKDSIHPSHERSIKIIEEYFESRIVPEQEIFKIENIREIIILYIREHFKHKNDLNGIIFHNNKEFESKIRNLMKKAYEEEYTNKNDSIQIKIWNLIVDELNKYENEVKHNSKFKNKHTKTELCIQNIILALTYPRLDINVSKHLNHLLKAPFCIHPKTGLISVPLNENDILNFKLENIPEVEETIDDVNKNRKSKFFYFQENFKNFVDNLNNNSK